MVERTQGGNLTPRNQGDSSITSDWSSTDYLKLAGGCAFALALGGLSYMLLRKRLYRPKKYPEIAGIIPSIDCEGRYSYS